MIVCMHMGHHIINSESLLYTVFLKSAKPKLLLVNTHENATVRSQRVKFSADLAKVFHLQNILVIRGENEPYTDKYYIYTG